MKISSDPTARRRLVALAAAAVLALIAGVSVGAGSGAGGDGPAERGAAVDQATRERERHVALRQVDRLTLRQRVGQVTISSFPGTAAPDYIRRRLRARETAGVILFGANGGDRVQWRRLTGSLQRSAGGRALVMVDQEGGESAPSATRARARASRSRGRRAASVAPRAPRAGSCMPRGSG